MEQRSRQTLSIAQMLSYGLPMGDPIEAEKKPELFKECCKFICPSFVIDETNKTLMNELYRYMEGNSTRYDSKKGLWLWGPIGTGKSTILKILNCYSKFSKGSTLGNYPIGGFRFESASAIANVYSMRGSDALQLYTYNKGNPRTIAFDELGREPIPAKYFGTDLNVMQYIFQCRYELRNECITHVSTNKPPEEVQALYDAYIADRINEMFNVIKVTGSSRR